MVFYDNVQNTSFFENGPQMNIPNPVKTRPSLRWQKLVTLLLLVITTGAIHFAPTITPKLDIMWGGGSNEIRKEGISSAKHRHNASVSTSNVTIERYNKKFNATILVELAGEMGNQISFMAHGLILQWMLYDDYGVQSQIWLRHQENPKWIRARASMQMCFKSTQTMNFEEGNTEEFTKKKAMQEYRYGRNANSIVKGEENPTIQNLLKQFARDVGVTRSDVNASSINQSGTNSTISLPFIHSKSMALGGKDFDRYYPKIRKVFHFDFGSRKCCNPEIKPDPDETVFHFRNFKKELSKSVKRSQFAELGPNQAVQDLLGHLPHGSKVAIVSRFIDENVEHHVKAFGERGLRVRVISGNSGEQDFCFLLSAEKEIVGSSRSTFFRWAGYLGNAKTVRAYTVNKGGNGISRKSYLQSEAVLKEFVVTNFAMNSSLDSELV